MAVFFVLLFFSFSKIRVFYSLWFVIVLIFYFLNLDQSIIGKLLLVRHASYFIFGGIFALIVEQIDKKIRPHIFDISFLICVAFFATVINEHSLPPYFTPNPADHFWVTFINIIIFIFVPILILLIRNIPLIINKFTIILGGITYPAYLIHQKIGSVIINKLTPYMNSYITHTVTIIIIISFSYFLYRKDIIFRKYLKKKIKFFNK